MATGEDQQQPLDEIVWRSPPIVQEMNGIHTNTVLHYFARSPFFDSMSNNAVVYSQAVNRQEFHKISTRSAFEAEIQGRSGVEFMVVHDPSENDTKRDHSGVWVIRKQRRLKQPDRQDEITPVAEYFVVGDSVYMAPTVGAIVESRMISTASALTNLLAKATTLPLFTPSLGHTYLPPQPKAANTPANSERLSMTGSLRPSKENTPLPDSQARGSSVGVPDNKGVKAADTDRRGLGMLADSLRLAMQYGDEYMDETPLVGEPGNFIIHKAKASTTTSFATNSAPGSQKTTLSLKTDLPLPTEEADGEKTADGKKSKGGDRSPASPLSPLTPGGGRKRKKSRSAQGQGSGGKVTPS